MSKDLTLIESQLHVQWLLAQSGEAKGYSQLLTTLSQMLRVCMRKLASESASSRSPSWSMPLAAAVALTVTLTMVVLSWGLHVHLAELVASLSYQFKTSYAFFSIWYVAGMGVSTALGLSWGHACCVGN